MPDLLSEGWHGVGARRSEDASEYDNNYGRDACGHVIPASVQRCEVGNQVGTLLCVLQARKGHFRAGH